MQVDSLEGEQWEEEIPLTLGNPTQETLLLDRIHFLERDGVPLDIGVFAHGVGVDVVLGVLIHPPGIRNTDHGGSQNATAPVIELARGKHLTVGSFVGNKSKLGEQNTQTSSNQQLEPGVTNQHKPGNQTTQSERKPHKQGDVERRTLAHQASLGHSFHERCI